MNYKFSIFQIVKVKKESEYSSFFKDKTGFVTNYIGNDKYIIQFLGPSEEIELVKEIHESELELAS